MDQSASSGKVSRDVPGYEGLYRVSDCGIVQSLVRITKSGPKGGRQLKPATDHRGYLYVNLWRNNIPERWYIHQLVAFVFIGPRPEGQQVRHGPNGKLDNRASQLCYGTAADNMNDRIRDDQVPWGERNALAKVTEVGVAAIRERVAAGELHAQVARDYDISASAVGLIARGDRWKNADSPAVPSRNRSERNRLAKLTVTSAQQIRARHAKGESPNALAGDYGVTRATIMRVVNWETWKHVA